MYNELYKPELAIRISTNNFAINNNIKEIPLYAVFCISFNKSKTIYCMKQKEVLTFEDIKRIKGTMIQKLIKEIPTEKILYL